MRIFSKTKEEGMRFVKVACIAAAVFLSFVLASVAPSHAQDCKPGWLPIDSMDVPAGSVLALAALNDSTTPLLFAGGGFTRTVDGVQLNRVGAWDGEQWMDLAGGIGGTVVYALEVFDSGNGPELYAGGWFTEAGGQAVNYIARWDGESWHPVGKGMNGTVEVLFTWDDGTGPSLYAGGHFTLAGDAKANRIARWDGQNWFALGNGTNGTVSSLIGFDEGTTPAGSLIVGGLFTIAGETAVSSIARWDGSNWSPLGLDMGSASGDAGLVRDMAVGAHTGGSDSLYIGGTFTTVNETTANFIVRWDGTSWSGLDDGPPGGLAQPSISTLAVFDDGSTGPLLYAGGQFGTTAPTGHNIGLSRWGCVDGLNVVFDDEFMDGD